MNCSVDRGGALRSCAVPWAPIRSRACVERFAHSGTQSLRILRQVKRRCRQPVLPEFNLDSLHTTF